jgi:hypothetical protein
MFFAHENNLLANWENIIKFSIQDYITWDTQEAPQITWTKLLRDPKEARVHFIKEKWWKVR